MNNIQERIKGPAIALIIVGALNAAIALMSLLGGLLRLTGITGEQLPVSQSERAGYIVGTVIGYGLTGLGLIVAPVIIFGAVKMLRGQSYALAKTAAVLAIIPGISCCFIIGIPIGIWAFIVLRDPTVQAFFRGEMNQTDFSPPMPPNF